MKKPYFSPEAEILYFYPACRLATGNDENDANLLATDVTSEDVPDVTIPGSQIPGW